jgi:hypothetical protein
MEPRLPQLAVCSYNEVPSAATVETLAMLGSSPAEPVGAIS